MVAFFYFDGSFITILHILFVITVFKGYNLTENFLWALDTLTNSCVAIELCSTEEQKISNQVVKPFIRFFS